MKNQIGIDKVLELLQSGKLESAGYNLSFLAVIKPVDYDMSKGCVFYKDFAIIFNSTSERMRDDIAGGIKAWLIDNTRPMVICIDLDEFKATLQQLAHKKAEQVEQLALFPPGSYSANMFLIEILHNLLSILLLNSEKIYLFSYAVETKVGDIFWTCVSTQKVDVQEIKKMFDAKVDWISGSTCKSKKGFMPIVTEREKEVKYFDIEGQK